MSEPIAYHGPAIQHGGDATVQVDGEFVVVDEVQRDTGKYIVLEDARFQGDTTHTYFVPEDAFEDGKGKRAS